MTFAVRVRTFIEEIIFGILDIFFLDLGNNYEGDIRVTLESGRRFEIPAPADPADNYIDFVDENGNVLTARAQVTPREAQDTEELKTYSRRKGELQKDMEKSYSFVFCQYL